MRMVAGIVGLVLLLLADGCGKVEAKPLKPRLQSIVLLAATRTRNSQNLYLKQDLVGVCQHIYAVQVPVEVVDGGAVKIDEYLQSPKAGPPSGETKAVVVDKRIQLTVTANDWAILDQRVASARIHQLADTAAQLAAGPKPGVKASSDRNLSQDRRTLIVTFTDGVKKSFDADFCRDSVPVGVIADLMQGLADGYALGLPERFVPYDESWVPPGY